ESPPLTVEDCRLRYRSVRRSEPASKWDVVFSERRFARSVASETRTGIGEVRTVLPSGRCRRSVRAHTCACTGLAAEELHGLRLNFGRILRLTVLILPRASLQTALDVALATLLQVLRAKLRELSPDDDSMPFRPFLLLSAFIRPGLIRRDREIRDCRSARRVPN